MKKTISINISGYAFVIEEGAYSRLRKYLDTIRSYFTSADGVEEIMTDIELRIAELFKERLDNKREVVDESDVEHVIGIMGQPEAFIGEDENDHEAAGSFASHRESSRRRRIFRDPDHKTLGGVAGGIAAYFGTDPVWIRLAFVILTLGGLAGIPIYIILWIIMPEATTAAEKLEMRGEPVTAENIGRKVSESFDSVKKNVSDLADSDKAAAAGKRAQNWIEELFIFLGRVILLFLKFIVYLVGIVMIIAAIAVLIAFTFALFGLGDANLLVIGGERYGLGELKALSELVFLPNGSWLWMLIALIIVVGIPLLALLYGGIRLLFGIKGHVKGLGVGLAVLWTIGVIGIITVTARTSQDFSNKQEYSELTRLNDFSGDTLKIGVLDDPHFSKNLKPGNNDQILDAIRVANNHIIMGNPRVNVVSNERDTIFEIAVFRLAQGASRIDAIERAERIEYFIESQDGEVNFQPYYTFPESDQFRNQRVLVEVRVPLGKSVHFSQNIDRVIYDVKNSTNTYDGDMVGKTWTMLSEGLTCLGCDPAELKSKWQKRR